jgi:hypothetical protein
VTGTSTDDVEPLDPPKGITTSATDVPPDVVTVSVTRAPELRELPPQEATVRASLAYYFTWLFVATVVAGFVSSITGYGWASTKEFLQLILPAETALLGSAVGFCFGTRKSDSGG